MENLCLGEIEVVGFTAAVEAADVAVKTANVELLGYELAGGGGMVAVKVKGQVGAVRAAIAAASEAASKVSRVVSTQIIPRPSDQLGAMIESADTVGSRPPTASEKPTPPQPDPIPPEPAPDMADPTPEPALLPEPEPTVAPEPVVAPEPASAPVPKSTAAEKPKPRRSSTSTRKTPPRTTRSDT